MSERTFDTVDFFTDQSIHDDLFPYFEHLRRQCPVTTLPHHGVVAVTGYDESSEIWRDSNSFSSCLAVTGPFPGLQGAHEADDIRALIEEQRDQLPMSEYLITADPPAHTELRALLMRLLTPKRLQENEAFIWRLAEMHIDAVIEKGRFESLHGLAQPFALLVIADLLGVPEEDHRAFAKQFGVTHPLPSVSGGEEQEITLDPLSWLHETFSAYIEDRRREPRNDVLSQMAAITYPDGTIPEVDDVVRTATFLFAAGQDTTARLITAALHLIAEDPELQQRLRHDSSLIPNFLEEVLRLEGPVKTVSRVALDVVSVGGVEIPAGTVVAIFPHAANRDPARFEEPNELRVDRQNAREHLAFGRGVHSCPGGPLARVEARIAIERLLARMSDIRISDEHHGPPGDRRFEQEPTYILRGIRALHLEFTSA